MNVHVARKERQWSRRFLGALVILLCVILCTGMMNLAPAYALSDSTTIKLDAATNGGTISGDATVKVTADGRVANPLPKAEKEGYVFNGWFTDSFYGTGILKPGDKNPTSETTYYARFTDESDSAYAGSFVYGKIADDSAKQVYGNYGEIGKATQEVTNNYGIIETMEGGAEYNYGTIGTLQSGNVWYNKGIIKKVQEKGKIYESNDAVGIIGELGGTMNTNAGTVTTVTGTGQIQTNSGSVDTLENGGRINVNGGKGVITTNNGSIYDNYGTVTTNNKSIGVNYDAGTVTENLGTIGQNKGTVTTNGSSDGASGTITTNDGTVETSYTDITTNNGTINSMRGTIDKNYGTVTLDKGGVITSAMASKSSGAEAKVTINEGGAVVAAYGGTLYNNGGTIGGTGESKQEGVSGATVYNYSGTVKTYYNANGGTVYNFSGGTVEINQDTTDVASLKVYDFGGTVTGTKTDGIKVVKGYEVKLGDNVKSYEGDYVLGPNGEIYLPEDGTLTLTPADGVTILDAVGKGTLTENEDGTYTLSNLSGNVDINNYKSYYITYDLAGGAEETANPTIFSADTETFSLKAPVRKGFTFTGWTGTNLSEPTLDVTIEKGSTGDRSYTANWEKNTYTISYDLAGGAVAGSNPVTYDVESDTITLTAPIREGYEFLGWTGTDLPEPTPVVTIEKGSVGDRSYTANWKVIDYTITYDLGIGALAEGDSNPATYTYEDTVTLKNPPSVLDEEEGYTTHIFTGWTGTGLDEPTMEVTIPKGSTGNKEYKANWKENTDLVKVTFVGWTNEKTKSVTRTYDLDTAGTALDTVLDNSKVNNLSKYKKGYDFQGWYTQEEGGTKVTADSARPDKDTTYYAQWKIRTVTVKLDGNGGTNGGTFSGKYDTVIGGTFPASTRAGYIFNGWWSKDAKGNWDSVKSPADKYPEYNATYYARWTEKTSDTTKGTITDEYEDSAFTGTADKLEGFMKTNQGTIGEVTEKGQVGENYGTIGTYKGTDTDSHPANYGTIDENQGNLWTNYNELETNSGTLKTNNGTIKTNKGTVETNTEKGTVETNEGTVTTNNGTVNTNTKDGTIATNNGTVKENSGTISENAGTIKENSGTVNGNTGTVEYNTGTVKGNTGTVYNFGGTVENGEGGTVIEYYTIAKGKHVESIEYVKGFTEYKNTKWLKAVDGTATIKVTLSADIDEEAFAVKATGCDLEKKGDGTYTLRNATGNVTITAAAVPYKISYDLAGGTAEGNPESYTWEDTVTLNNPTRGGYDFVGWSGTDLAGTENLTVTIPSKSTGERSYTANWKKKEFTITYDLAGGTVETENPATYDVETADFTLVNPTRAGYVFAGWTGTGLAESTETVTVTTGTLGDLSYKANWKPCMVMAKVKASGKTTLKLSWNKVSGAKYVIYQAKVGKSYKKVATVKGTSKTFKKLKKGTKYKYYVKAVDAAGKTISKSKDVYSLTGNTKGKYTNTKSLKVTPAKKTLAVGKTVTLKAKAKGVKKGKKILAKGLCSQYRYIVTTADGKTTSNVVTVSSKGKVTAKKTGTAKVYVLAPNGVQKTVTITVK